jgi:hypothetical protein
MKVLLEQVKLRIRAKAIHFSSSSVYLEAEEV